MLRLLIVRLSAIGDVIHGMPMACALRQRLPEAMLTWAVEQRAAELLDGHAALDHRIVLPRGWLRSPTTVWRLRRQLRELRFDVAIDAQGLTKSAVVAWLSGARRRIGLGGTWGRELSPWLNTERIEADDLHAVDRGLRLLRPLGIESPEVRFEVPDPPAAGAAADAIVRTQRLEGGVYAVAKLRIHAKQYMAAWDAFMGDWLPSSGYQPDDRPCFEIYLNEPWHFELRPRAIDHGCPRMYADAAHDPRMQQ